MSGIFRKRPPVQKRKRWIGTVAAAAVFITGAGGIASQETIGFPKVNLSVKPSAIISAEAFGAAQLNQKIALSGIASAEAFGTLKINQKIIPSAIPSVEGFGVHTIQVGAEILIGAVSIASGETFGAPKLNPSIQPFSIGSAEAFGAAQLNQKIALSGIASAQALGNPAIQFGGALTIAATGIASKEAFGSVSFDGGIRCIQYLLRIQEIDYGQPGILILKCVDEDTAIFLSESQAAAGQASIPPPTQGLGLPGSTKLQLLDIPLLRDRDDGSGFIAAVTGFSRKWRGALLYKSRDGGESFDEIDAFTGSDEAEIGFATTALASWPIDRNTFDYSSTVIVRLIKGTLSSQNELNVLNGANAGLLGNEIVQFKTATLNADGSYTLSELLRGRRGTEWAQSGHVAGERFVMLTQDGVHRISTDSSERNLLRHYRGVSIGTFLEDAETIAFTNSDVGLKCYSPVHIAGSRDGSNNLTITAKRRTRIGGAWLDFVDVPLGEASESYECDIMSGSTVKRTLTSATLSFSYTAAQQTTDFGAPQAAITVNIYQLSAAVGRGYPGNATV